MSRLLLSLWLLAAALIAGSTLVALNAIFGWTSGPAKIDHSYIAERRAIALGRGPAADVASQSNLDVPPEAGAKEAAPQPAVALRSMQPEQRTHDSEAPASAEKSDEADSEGIRVRVAQAANVRAGPSSSAARLKTFQAGTELRALAREGGWVQVTEASESEVGWIYEKLLEPMEPGPSSPGGEEASGLKGESARVADKAAVVRAGPSEEAAMLFGFPYGRELRVLSREAGFAEIVDLASKQTGWIAESALESADSAQRIASPQRKSRSASDASLARSGDVALPADETMREAWSERPRKRARQARRGGGLFNRAIRRGLGSR